VQEDDRLGVPWNKAPKRTRERPVIERYLESVAVGPELDVTLNPALDIMQ